MLLSCGLAPHVSNPYKMAIAAIDEAIRNAVAAGADVDKLAILDNFCWPGAHDEVSMGNLAMTCQACYDASLAYGIPFISGKDSLHNQFTNQQTGEVIRIPNTLLISAIGVIDDVKKLVSMDLKTPGNKLVRVLSAGQDLASLNRLHRALAKFIATGKVKSCHDISDGGWLTAAAEMALAGNRGAILTFADDYFTECDGGYVLEIAKRRRERARKSPRRCRDNPTPRQDYLHADAEVRRRSGEGERPSNRVHGNTRLVNP